MTETRARTDLGAKPAAPTGRPRRSRRQRTRTELVHLEIAVALVALLVIGASILVGLELTHTSSTSTSRRLPPPVLPTPIHHVIVIFMHGEGLSNVLANGTFERYLYSHYASAGQYYALPYVLPPAYTPPGGVLADYIDATTGALYTNLAGNISVAPVLKLIDGAHETWAAYMEGMPVPCDQKNDSTAGYYTEHDPFVHYTYIVSNQTYCNSHVQALNVTSWNEALASDSLPNYVWVTPNATDDGGNGSVKGGDAWLKNFLSPLINSTAFSDSVVLLTYDFNASTTSTLPAQVYMVAVSPYAHVYWSSSVRYTHFNLLTTTEWLLGLGNTGPNDDPAANPAMKDLFDLGRVYNVTGTVTASNGTVFPDATVGGGGYSVSTNLSGGYRIPLPNGTYSFSASHADGSCASPASLFDENNGTITSITLGNRIVANVSFQLTC